MFIALCFLSRDLTILPLNPNYNTEERDGRKVRVLAEYQYFSGDTNSVLYVQDPLLCLVRHEKSGEECVVRFRGGVVKTKVG